MIFSYVYLLDYGDVRIVYDVHQGTRERAFPRDVSDIVSAEWDADEMTLNAVDSTGEPREFTLTLDDIEQAKEGSPL